MKKLLANIGLVALGCFGAHAAAGDHAIGSAVTGVLTCVAANVAGLYQKPPVHNG